MLEKKLKQPKDPFKIREVEIRTCAVCPYCKPPYFIIGDEKGAIEDMYEHILQHEKEKKK